MHIEKHFNISSEKSYEDKAREFFVEEVFPSDIFQNFIRNQNYGLIFLTKTNKSGEVVLPRQEYDERDNGGYYNANTQLSIDNLSSVLRMMARYSKNKDSGVSSIKASQLKPYNITIDKGVIEEREKSCIIELEEYENNRKKGSYLANKFFKILKDGKSEEEAFSRAQKVMQNPKMVENNVKKFPPTHRQRKNIESVLHELDVRSFLSDGSVEIQRNLCRNEVLLPFCSQDEYGLFLDSTFSVLPEIQKELPDHFLYMALFNDESHEKKFSLPKYGLIATNYKINWKKLRANIEQDSVGSEMLRFDDLYRKVVIDSVLRQNPLIIDPVEKKVTNVLNSGYSVENIFRKKEESLVSFFSEKEGLLLGLDSNKPVFATFEYFPYCVEELKRQMNPSSAKYIDRDIRYSSGIQISAAIGKKHYREIYDVMDKGIDSVLSKNSSILRKVNNLRNSVIRDVYAENGF